MAEQSLWQRLIAAIHSEYDRRIRRASLVTEYGVGHHGQHHDEQAEADHADETAEIVNVPRGTPVGRRPPPDPEHPSA